METSILINYAKKKAAEIPKKVVTTPSPSAETFLNKIRQNLVKLMCQADMIEAAGDVDELGGVQQIGEDIAKAIINLLSLGAFLGVDVEKVLSSFVGEKETSASVKPKEVAPVEEKLQALALEKSSGTPDNKSDLFKTEDSQLDSYKNRFKNAKTEAEIGKIWGDITKDKDLPGPHKFELQTDRKGALLRVKSNIY